MKIEDYESTPQDFKFSGAGNLLSVAIPRALPCPMLAVGFPLQSGLWVFRVKETFLFSSNFVIPYESKQSIGNVTLSGVEEFLK